MYRVKKRLDPTAGLWSEITVADEGMRVYGVELVGMEVTESQWWELTRRFRASLNVQLGHPRRVLSTSQAHDRVLYEFRPANSQDDLEGCARFSTAHQVAEEHAFEAVGRPLRAFLDVKTLH